jgi:UDP-N-acetylmuramoylalanine--D-glutamate ligase
MTKSKNIFLGKKILIYGLGKSGVSSYKFLNNRAKVFLFDDNLKKKINSRLNQRLKDVKEVSKIKFDKIIISPGIDISSCRLANILKKDLSKIYTDLDVFYSFYKNKSIAITGTNGKSTTAKILHEVLLGQKYDSRLIGNIGNPVLSEKKITKKTVFVIEASSYQLDYSKIFTSKYALILNITPDHLERHKNLKNYINAKFKLLDSQSNKSIALVKQNDSLISGAIKKGRFKQKIIKVDTSKNDKIFDQLKNQYFSSFGNKENLSFILKISKILKLDNKKILKTLNKFKGLKYRQQIIYEKKDLTIINDSKSTSFASSENLLKSFNKVYWILGGIPKKNDRFKLTKKNCENFKAFIFGKNYKEFRTHLKKKMFVSNFLNLKDVLKRILSTIKKEKLKKNIIFFSPAGASFDNFKDFEDRGHYFNQLVKKTLNEKQ